LIKRIGTLRGEIRVDLEVHNLYYEQLSRKICNNTLKIDYDELVSAVIRAKKEKDPEKKLFSLCAENKMLKTALKVSNVLTYFVVSCVMFQSGFLDVADKYVKKCLEIDSKNVDYWVLLAHIDIYNSEGKNAIKYVKKALELQNDHLLAAKIYLELISSQEVPTQIVQQKELLKDLSNIMNNADIPKEWAVEIGLRIWFVMVNITPGRLIVQL
jgi:tetratricopeptide (TPR) repeat protein